MAERRGAERGVVEGGVVESKQDGNVVEMPEHAGKYVDAETRRVRREEDQVRVERVRQQALEAAHPTLERAPKSESAIRRYIEDNLPVEARTPSAIGAVFEKAIGLFARWTGGAAWKEGRSRLPKEGPFLVASSHSGGETGSLLGLLAGYKAHVMAGEQLNFKRSPMRSWLLKKMGMLPIPESLSLLSEPEKDALIERVPAGVRRDGYRTVREQERMRKPFEVLIAIRQAVALLARGEAVTVFPEGLFLYDGAVGLRKAYPIVDLIRREYVRVTGKELPIVPVGFEKAGKKKRMRVGDPVLLAADEKRVTDTVMRRIADLLPEEQRGPYGK